MAKFYVYYIKKKFPQSNRATIFFIFKTVTYKLAVTFTVTGKLGVTLPLLCTMTVACFYC